MSKREGEILAKIEPDTWYSARKLGTNAAFLNSLWREKKLTRRLSEVKGFTLNPGESVQFKLKET